MKYIKNKLDFSIKFAVGNKTFVFDCFRVYSDTGNVATTGVTPVEESVFNDLYANCKQFKAFLDSGKLALTTKDAANEVAGTIDSLQKENEKLKAALEEKKKEAALAESEKTKKLEKENATLKEQLEALGKKSSKSKKTTQETDGGF